MQYLYPAVRPEPRDEPTASWDGGVWWRGESEVAGDEQESKPKLLSRGLRAGVQCERLAPVPSPNRGLIESFFWRRCGRTMRGLLWLALRQAKMEIDCDDSSLHCVSAVLWYISLFSGGRGTTSVTHRGHAEAPHAPPTEHTDCKVSVEKGACVTLGACHDTSQEATLEALGSRAAPVPGAACRSQNRPQHAQAVCSGPPP